MLKSRWFFVLVVCFIIIFGNCKLMLGDDLYEPGVVVVKFDYNNDNLGPIGSGSEFRTGIPEVDIIISLHTLLGGDKFFSYSYEDDTTSFRIHGEKH